MIKPAPPRRAFCPPLSFAGSGLPEITASVISTADVLIIITQALAGRATRMAMTSSNHGEDVAALHLEHVVCAGQYACRCAGGDGRAARSRPNDARGRARGGRRMSAGVPFAQRGRYHSTRRVGHGRNRCRDRSLPRTRNRPCACKRCSSQRCRCRRTP